jgi:glycosyltransferase involved in cell wall biosynthesis
MCLDLHNIESDLKNEFATHSDRFPRSWINRLFAHFAAQQERRWLPKFDHLFTTSEHDKERTNTILQESGHPGSSSSISVIPNCIDVEFYASIGQDTGQKKRLLFCGGLDFPPNRTAIELLVHRVFPQVRRDHKDCELWIVGKDDPHWTKPQADGVTFTGFVADIRPYIEDATMILAPILNGSGTRFKVLEAWAARRPLIATTKAVEGLNAMPMTHFCLADTESDFVERINQILRAPEQTRHMVDAAYQFVNTHYNARMIGERFRATLTALFHEPR